MAEDTDRERIEELEIKLAYQDHKIAALDELVRRLADRLDHAQRELVALKESVRSPEVPLGPPGEPPPHY